MSTLSENEYAAGTLKQDDSEKDQLRLFDDINNEVSCNANSIVTNHTRSDIVSNLINVDVPDEFLRIFMPLETQSDQVKQAKLDTRNIFCDGLLGRQHTIKLVQYLTLEEYLRLLHVNSEWREALISVQHQPPGYSKTDQLLKTNFAQVYCDPCKRFTYVTMLYNSINLDSVIGDVKRTTFMIAALKDDLPTMRILLAKSCNVYQRDLLGNDVLHLAIRYKKTTVIAWLLNANFDPNRITLSKQSPLHLTLTDWFRYTGSLENATILRMLLDHNADLNALDNEGDTPYHLAARHHDTFPLYLLMDIRDAPMDLVTNLFGETVLHVAARAGYINTIRMLLNWGMDVNARDNFCATPLHRSAWMGNLPNCQLLMAQKDINVNAVTLIGKTALHRAAVEGHMDVVTALLDKDADINIKDNNGLSVVQNVLQTTAHSGTLKILMKHPNLDKEDQDSIMSHFKEKSRKSKNYRPKVSTIFKTGTALEQTLSRLQEYESRVPAHLAPETPPPSSNDTDTSNDSSSDQD